MRTSETEKIEALQQRASALAAEAEALTDTYQRTTWVRFVAVFFPVPFVVVLLRLALQPRPYYPAGGPPLRLSPILYLIHTQPTGKVPPPTQTTPPPPP